MFSLALLLFPKNFPLKLWLPVASPFCLFIKLISTLMSDVCYEIVLIFRFYCRLSSIGSPA